MISTADIYTFATEKERLGNPIRVTGGIYSLLQADINLPHYWEFNEYGIVYYRVVLEKVLFPQSSNSDKGHSFSFTEFVRTIGRLIKKAQSFYEGCQYSGNIEVAAQLRGIWGEQLMYGLKQSPNQMKKQQSADSEISVSAQYLPRDLVKREKFIEIADKLASQLLWAFNVDDPQGRRKMIEEILIANKLLES
jgi:hypothetical protein